MLDSSSLINLRKFVYFQFVQLFSCCKDRSDNSGWKPKVSVFLSSSFSMTNNIATHILFLN